MDKRMTAKEYLEQAYRLDQRINAKLEQIMQLRSLSQRYTVAFGGEHVSHTSLQKSLNRLASAATTDANALIDLCPILTGSHILGGCFFIVYGF